jgi:hypothetical protein
LDQVIDLLDAAAKSYPLKALAPEIGKAWPTLQNELTEQLSYKLGLRTAFQVWLKTGDLKSLDRIERLLGRVAFPVPRPSRNPAKLMELMGRLAKEFGEHVQTMGASLADGEVDPEEAKLCLRELRELIEAAVQLQAHLEQLSEPEG